MMQQQQQLLLAEREAAVAEQHQLAAGTQLGAAEYDPLSPSYSG